MHFQLIFSSLQLFWAFKNYFSWIKVNLLHFWQYMMNLGHFQLILSIFEPFISWISVELVQFEQIFGHFWQYFLNLGHFELISSIFGNIFMKLGHFEPIFLEFRFNTSTILALFRPFLIKLFHSECIDIQLMLIWQRLVMISMKFNRYRLVIARRRGQQRTMGGWTASLVMRLRYLYMLRDGSMRSSMSLKRRWYLPGSFSHVCFKRETAPWPSPDMMLNIELKFLHSLHWPEQHQQQQQQQQHVNNWIQLLINYLKKILKIEWKKSL